MNQPDNELSTLSLLRADSLPHRLQRATDADGKEHFQRMDQEIHDNLLSIRSVGILPKIRQHIPRHPIPDHIITEHPYPPHPRKVTQRGKLCRESVPPDRLSVSHTPHSPDTLIFLNTARLK